MVVVFGTLLALTLGAVVLFLVLPLRVELMADRDEAFRYSATLQPFGRIGPRIPLKGGARTSGSRRTTRPNRKKRRADPKPDPSRMARAALRALVDILRAVHLDAAILNLRFGFGDPAETGEFYGQMTPLIYGLAGCSRWHVRVEPVFGDVVFSGRAQLDFSCVPARILWPVARFGWTAFGPAR